MEETYLWGYQAGGAVCVMMPGGRSGWMSRKVRGYGVDYFGLPWRSRLIQQYPAGFSWLLYEWEGDEDLKMKIRLVSFSTSAKSSACDGS